jgi:hypothetical protein
MAKTIYRIKAVKSNSKKFFEKTLLLNDEQRNLIALTYPKNGCPVWKSGEDG